MFSSVKTTYSYRLKAEPLVQIVHQCLIGVYRLIETMPNFYQMEFKQQINEVHPPMKFDFKFSNKEINFFDAVVSKRHSSKLDTKLYRKESNRLA